MALLGKELEIRKDEIDKIYLRLLEKMEVEYVKDIADKFNILDTAISSKKSRGTLHYEEIITYCLENNISIDYIMKGVDNNKSIVIYSKDEAKNFRNDNDLLIPFFGEIKKTKDGICFNSVSSECITGFIPLNKKTYNLIDTDTQALKAFDDSMAATIKTDNIIFVDRNNTTLNEGKIHFIKVDNELYIKRLFKGIGSDKFILKSDNIAYPVFEVEPSKVEILGLFIYSIKSEVDTL